MKAGPKHGAPPAVSPQPERSPGPASPHPAKLGHGQGSHVRRHRRLQAAARHPRAPLRRELHDRPRRRGRGGVGRAPGRPRDDCLQELRWIYDRRELAEAKADLAAWLKRWGARYDRLTSWVEENIEETFTYY